MENRAKQAENLLKVITETKSWVLKDGMERYINTWLDARKFLLHDLVSFSLATVGIVIPILLSSDFAANINIQLIFLSVSVFILHIIVGTFTRFIISRKELASWPRVRESVDKGLENDMKEVVEGIKNNIDIDIIYDKLLEKLKNKKNNEKKQSLIDKIVNLDYWLFGLFMVGFLILVVAILKVIITKLHL